MISTMTEASVRADGRVLPGGRVLICDMPPGDCAAPSWREGTRSIGDAKAAEARQAARAAGWSRATVDGFKFDLCPACTARRNGGAGTRSEEV